MFSVHYEVELAAKKFQYTRAFFRKMQGRWHGCEDLGELNYMEVLTMAFTVLFNNRLKNSGRAI